jgi:two-component system, NarL family, response regulator DesR
VIRVLLADDETLIRDAVAALLHLETDIEVVARCSDGGDAVARALELEPAVALLDLQMPVLDGIEVTDRLRVELPECRCVLLTSHGRPGYLKAALSAGARGFLPKTTPATRLADAVRIVAEGGRYVDPELAAEAMAAGDSPLTAREADVLALAADGRAVHDIAIRAALSPGTVRNYLSNAFMKLGAENRHEAIRTARERGWI